GFLLFSLSPFSPILLAFEMPCSCGSQFCRGVITNRDYLNPAWQKQYGHHLPQHVLQALI
ncbi:MAG TPA: hypothetical protein VEC93_05445, partial [Anaerolineae bacterium]|nr:hypothetical protein [Anaerolineae bacterium]